MVALLASADDDEGIDDGFVVVVEGSGDKDILDEENGDKKIMRRTSKVRGDRI